MVGTVTSRTRRRVFGLAAGWLCSTSLLVGVSSAQTTVVLNQSGTQVTDTTIRNGTYANTNCDGATILTRNSAADPNWERRAILKFDTANTIPAGSKISSAELTLTLKSGLGTAGQTRTVNAYRISSPFQEAQATWMTRESTSRWATPGGDIAEQFASAAVSNVAGSTVTFDVTNLVQQTSDGKFDSRYTRIALIDVGSDTKESYREYYSSKDVDPARRPTADGGPRRGVNYASPASATAAAPEFHAQDPAVEHRTRHQPRRPQVEHRSRGGLHRCQSTRHHFVQRNLALLERHRRPAEADRGQAQGADGRQLDLPLGAEVGRNKRGRRVRDDAHRHRRQRRTRSLPLHRPPMGAPLRWRKSW